MICENCGKQIPNDSKFCIFCGKEATNLVEFKLATSQRRFVNLILDQIGVMVFALGVGMILGLVGIIDQNFNEDNYTLLGWTIIFFYYFLCEIIWKKTLGKVITRTHVISVEGGEPTVGQIIGRTFCRFIPFDALSFFGSNPAGWHDKFSNTRVVMDE